MSIKLAQASSSEFYSTWGVAGRQREGELNIVEWRRNASNEWHHVFRAKDPAKREIIAKFFEAAVASQLVGYSQCNGDSPRETLYDYAKAVNWDISKLTNACNTDCSALAGAAVAAAGIESKDLRTMFTGNAVEVLKKTGAFDIFTDDAHCKMESNLIRGDLVLRNGHMACAINSARTHSSDRYCTTHDCASVNFRSGPGVEYDIVRTVAGNSVLPYIKTDAYGWINCMVGNATGWLSPKYCYLMALGQVFNGNVNIRASVGTGKILGVMKDGELCHIYKELYFDGRNTTWYKVYYNGIVGYSSSKYVRKLLDD